MALTFPFLDILPLSRTRTFEFFLRVRKERARETAGRARGKLIGPALWRVSIGSGPLSYSVGKALEARLLTLVHDEKRFKAWDIRTPFPFFDPNGNIPVESVTIDTVGTNNTSLRLFGLPTGYVVNVGDKLEIVHSSTRSSLVEAVEPATATIDTRTPLFEVRPYLRPGVTAGMVVKLHRPGAYFLIDDESVKVVNSPGKHIEVSWFAEEDW